MFAGTNSDKYILRYHKPVPGLKDGSMLLALTNLESKDNKGEEPESFLQTSIAISFNSKVTYTWRYYPLYTAV